MAREVDATYGNMLHTLKNASANVKEAQKRTKDALDAVDDAELLINQITELIKIRRKGE